MVFLDVKMPGLDGVRRVKKIVERKMKMPHVVFARRLISTRCSI